MKNYKEYKGFGIERRFKDNNKRDDIILFICCSFLIGMLMYILVKVLGLGFVC